MAHIIKGYKPHAIIRLNSDFADPAIVNAHIEPCIWLDMKHSTYQVTNEICMANDDFVFISPPGALEISLERLVSLSFPLINIVFRYISEVFVLDEFFWDGWDTFPQQLRSLDLNSRKLFGDDFRSFYRSSQAAAMDGIDLKRTEAFRCLLGLFFSNGCLTTFLCMEFIMLL